ncbi:MAG TPA: transposase [Gammaproteobacteria bacterium]|nr:transposase [Gammaproteobacteria bacterium]
MTRPLRIEFPGALYHVTSRGDRQEDIYLVDEDREAYLDVLNSVCERFNWVVHAYCLMSNHYHLLIETPDSNLSQGMRQLNGVYTQRFNRRHKRVGHVYQGRYKAILVQKENYLLELARYIVLNPVRAEMVRSAKDWPWSSYRATAGLKEAEDFLHVDWVLSAFAKRKSLASERYREFVSHGKNQPKPWTALKNQIYLGTDSFVDEMQCKVMPDKDLSEVVSSQKRPMVKELGYYEKKYKQRDEAIIQAYMSGGYSMKEVGEHFHLHYSRVSRIVKAKGKT